MEPLVQGEADTFLYRGIGHPWTCDPAWDQLYLAAPSRERLERRIATAKEKFWHVWFCSWETLRCHLYKPSDITREWEDVRWQGTPRAHGHQFRVGDEVYTDFGRRITRHRVVGIEFRPISQTGVMLKVTPAPPGSKYQPEDSGAPPGREPGLPWIDSAWFRKVS